MTDTIAIAQGKNSNRTSDTEIVEYILKIIEFSQLFWINSRSWTHPEPEYGDGRMEVRNNTT